MVSRWCQRAADGLFIDLNLDSMVMQADASTEPGRCTSRIARVRVALKLKWCNHTIALRGRVQAGVCGAEAKSDESSHDGGLRDALHPANINSPA